MTHSKALLGLCLVFATLAAQAQSAGVDRSIDNRLINTCAARTDARMGSMTQRKLEQIRNYEFSLRMAAAQLVGGSSAMSSRDWQLVTAQVQEARTQLAEVCDISLPL